MKILVTGATGFIGSRLVKELVKQHIVSVLCRDVRMAQDQFGDTVQYIMGDISDRVSIRNCCKGIDIVYHLAAIMGHDVPSDEAFAKFRTVNVLGTKNIVQEAQKSKVKRFVHISSTAAIGLTSSPIVNEETACVPWSPYQVSKRESELYLLNKIHKEDFQAVIIRPSMIYGPGFQGDFLTIAKVVKTGFFPRLGLGKNLSPALFIDDLIPPLIEAGIASELHSDIYIISSETSFPLKQVVQIIGSSLGKKIHFLYCPKWCAIMGASVLETLYRIFKKKPPITARNIKSTVTDRIFDISKAKRDLHYKQNVSIEAGLTQTIAYFKQKNWL